LEVRFALNLPLLDTVLTKEAGAQGNVGRLVVRADCATGRDHGAEHEGELARMRDHLKILRG
jgi:hypothetical protein